MAQQLTTRWRWLFRQVARQLWLTAVIYALAAIASVFIAAFLGPYIPASATEFIKPKAVGDILSILASSMLAVTTFSLATMVSAHGSVTSNTSPRATALVIDNEVTRHALGAFIGSFLFSLVGIVALSAGAYGERGHVVLFAVMILVIVLIVVALLRWIDHLSQLARVSETSERVENSALDALVKRAHYPGLGGRACRDIAQRIPADASTIVAQQVGYVQHIDMAALIELSRRHKLELFVVAEPGAFVGLGRPLLRVAGDWPEDFDSQCLCDAFSIGQERTFDYDPRYGLIVLAEIASRALSPGINDPGTAIDIIGRVTRVLSIWATTKQLDNGEETADGAKVWFPRLDANDLLEDVFSAIARDGSGTLSIQIRLQKSLAALAGLEHAELERAARLQSQRAWERARDVLQMPFEREALEQVVLQAGD